MQVNRSDLIFEIKTSRRGHIPSMFLLDITKRTLEKVREYQEITKRKASLRIILVVNFEPSYVQKLLSRRDEVLEGEKNIEMGFESYTFGDIGLSEFQDEQ